MKTIVFDLEMNQPSGTIIEIGAVKVDLKNRRIEDRFQSFCRLDNEDLNPEITTLTNIQPEDLTKAPHFKDASLQFWKWFSEAGCGKRLTAWGHDTDILKKACDKQSIPYPEKIKVFDLCSISEVFRFAADFPKKHRGGLKSSLEGFQIPFEGSQHRALDDAQATAQLFIHLYQMARKSFQVQSLFKS
ncbi:MAG: 3'-5' exonuclease [Oligoflexales bacterium]